MKILFACVEMSPLVKVGGLADVAGALPKALIALGHDVRVVLPMHQGIDTMRYGFRRVASGIETPTPRGPEPTAIWEGRVGPVPVYLIESADMFERPQVYGEADDTQRWLFYCDALLAGMPRIDWQPDLLHLHDWHAAFVATRLTAAPDHPYAGLPIVYTIHNLALKGDFDEDFAQANGLQIHAGYDPGVEGFLLRSGMAQGILQAHVINTVSPAYAREILTPEFGAGLDPLLRRRESDVFGILNGIDTGEFDPARDPHLPSHFSADDLGGRAVVRRSLQRRAGLTERDDIPVIGIVNRLFWQKGADIAAEAVEQLLSEGTGFQFILLGTGDESYHRQLEVVAARFPDAVRLYLTFDPALAQEIYAGSDMFLMPSRYEPCGLGQMIAMRYGSVPVVRRTGGLADTVPDADEQPEAGRGFVFDAPEGGALANAIRRACAAFAQRDRWQAIQQRGMRADFSWDDAAHRYVELYDVAVARAGRAARG